MRYVRCLAFSALSLLALPALAQRGCYHSPEAPTDVLVIVGAVGMSLGSSAVRRLLRRRKTS